CIASHYIDTSLIFAFFSVSLPLISQKAASSWNASYENKKKLTLIVGVKTLLELLNCLLKSVCLQVQPKKNLRRLKLYQCVALFKIVPNVNRCVVILGPIRAFNVQGRQVPNVQRLQSMLPLWDSSGTGK